MSKRFIYKNRKTVDVLYITFEMLDQSSCSEDEEDSDIRDEFFFLLFARRFEYRTQINVKRSKLFSFGSTETKSLLNEIERKK